MIDITLASKILETIFVNNIGTTYYLLCIFTLTAELQ